MPLSLDKRVNQACDRFEAAWKEGQRPRIEEYLADVPEPDRAEFLREILRLKIELRSKGGDKPTSEEYEQRFPEHVELIRSVFAEPPDLDKEVPSSGNGEPSTIDDTPPPAESAPAVPDRIGRYKVCR